MGRLSTELSPVASKIQTRIPELTSILVAKSTAGIKACSGHGGLGGSWHETETVFWWMNFASRQDEPSHTLRQLLADHSTKNSIRKRLVYVA